jgi:hypothetical protein
MSFSGSYKEIKCFTRSDSKPLNSSCESSDEKVANNFKDLGLFNNPLEGLFGYHAKHNRESKEEGKSLNVAEYTNMKIFNLELAKDQNEDRFIAIQQLFFYFKDATEIHSKAISQKVEVFEDKLLSFVYNYSEKLKHLPADVLRCMEALIVTEHGRLEGETK